MESFRVVVDRIPPRERRVTLLLLILVSFIMLVSSSVLSRVALTSPRRLGGKLIFRPVKSTGSTSSNSKNSMCSSYKLNSCTSFSTPDAARFFLLEQPTAMNS